MNKTAALLKLLRWPNLLIMALILLVLRYGFILPLGFEVVLSPIWHTALILATILIAAGGNAVNDALDVHADRINKPEKMIVDRAISQETALFIGQALLLAGAILGLVLGYFNNMLTFSYIFPLAAFALWGYAKHIKKVALLGNLTIAFLAALMVFNQAIFDLLFTLKSDEANYQLQAVYVVIAVSAFSFFLTLARELVKDFQDIEGDRQAGYRTLAVTSGGAFPKILIIAILMFVVAALGWLLRKTIISEDWISSAYLFFFVIAPLLFTIIKVAPAKTAAHYKKLSLLLKTVMVTGLFSVLVFTFVLKSTF